MTITGGSTIVTGGAALATNENGGDANLIFLSDVTSDSTLELASGVDTPDAEPGDAFVSFSGDATFTGGATLTETNPGGDIVTLTFDGTDAQSFTGTIDGGDTDQGEIIISNTSAGGVTFNDAIGAGSALKALTVNTDASVQFDSDAFFARRFTIQVQRFLTSFL